MTTTNTSSPQPSSVLPSEATISPEAILLLAEEATVLDRTKTSLTRQTRELEDRFNRERTRARALTEELVTTRRAEDKQLIASDEAVSHRLTSHHDEALDTIKSLNDKPYFARVVLEEEDQDSGDIRKVEYKIGHAANPECRIIDWKKAPLSKLYYEYREGDEYFEHIQGKERVGKIALRNRVEIVKGALKRVDCRLGTFFNTGDSWSSTSSVTDNARDFSSLPDVLSLITPEQFKAITQEAASAVLIQGVAGSGKTTVALHRLTWLLANKEESLSVNDTVVLTLGPSLKAYVKTSLGQLGVPNVPVFSYREWSGKQLAKYLPPSLIDSETGFPTLTGSHDKAPSAIERTKRSMGLLSAIEAAGATLKERGGALPSLIDFVLSVLKDSKRVVALDTSKLLSERTVAEAYNRTAEIVTRGTLDRSDYSVLLRAAQVLYSPTLLLQRSDLFKHMIVDEVQDYAPIELATVLSTLTPEGTLTLVGDTAQRTEDGFPGWQKLQGWWAKRNVSSSFVKLEISHRCTKEIMTCAAILGEVPAPEGGRRGQKPVWMKADEQELVLRATIEWLKERSEAGPNQLIAVICFSQKTVRELYSLLEPSFGSLVRAADDGSLSFEEGIIIGDAYTMKGLEFHAVLVWDVVKSSLPQGDTGRHLLYVAATRAQEHLAFVTWGREGSPLSKVPERALTRYEVEQPEEEEEHQDDYSGCSVGDGVDD